MDEEAVDKKNCRYGRDDDSRREMSQRRTSSLSKEKRHKGEHEQKEINRRQQKTIEAQKISTKFRPVWPVLTKEAKINESDKDIDNTISNIVIIQEGLVTYSHNCMTVCCMTRDGDRNNVHCPSSVTDFTRISQDMVLATIPFRKMILSISPTSFKIKTMQLGLYLVSYFEHSTIIGVEMFGKTIYCIDWEENRIKYEFITKESPTDIAVGAQNKLLLSFSSINRIICYNVDGQQLWEVGTYMLDIPSKISLYQSYFYVLQGHIIYRISAKGGVTKRDIGRKCRSISVGKDTILVIDCFGITHAIRTNKDFWPKLSYNHQLHTPSLKHHIYIEDCYNITNILPMSTSSILIVCRNKKAMLFTDTGEIISQNNLTFLETPSVFCRINSSRFLVLYREMKGLQYITCPELSKGPLINVHTDYIKICHIVSNKCLALTTSKNKNEVHILLIKDDKIDIIERISLGHYNVTIAATPINFVVLDGRENKLVFYSTFSEELFEKYLPFYGYPHDIYSDNVYFYVLFKRQSTVICYDIYGEIKWQWKVPFSVHPHIAIFQGTVYVPDVELNKVLFYKFHDFSGCCLHMKNPYIRNLNLRLKDKENDKVVIAEICHLTNGQLVVSDINNDCLLYISNGGDIVSRLSLPSTATDICRWDSNQIGVTLPLEKQLRVIGNLSKTIRSISFSQPYVRVCKMGEGEIVCYSDKPSHLDILAIKYHNQVETIKTINIPFFVKSLSIQKETRKLLIVIKGKAFQFKTTIRGGGGGGPRLCSIKMDPSVLLSQVKRPTNLYGGSIDKLFVYLIENSCIFAINDHNLLVNDLITSNQLNTHFDLVDIFSRKICVSEMLSSISYLQDLTVSDKARHIHLPQCSGDEEPMEIDCLVITENNLIAGCDKDNTSIKIFTFDGQLLDSLKLKVYEFIKMCQWKSNTLVITTGDYSGNKYQLLTLKVDFPLSVLLYQTRNEYKCIASLSNNQMVCSKLRDECHLYFIDIDEIHFTVNEIKQIDIPETLLTRDIDGNCINVIDDITVNVDVIIVRNGKSIIFFNSDGQYLHTVTHYMKYDIGEDKMTTDDSYLYIHGGWDKDLGLFGYKNVVRLTQTGEYKGIFLNRRMYNDEVYFLSINCKGPRFVGSHKEWKRENELYVEGYFMINRESFSVSRLQTDKYSVQVKDIDISDEGKIVVCEKANNGNVKMFNRFGKLLCYQNVASFVGGVCFTHKRDIMATVPKRKEIFQLSRKYLQKYKVWQSRVPYGIIWRTKEDIYWCVHIELIECHCIKIDGDQLNILESVSLLNLDSGLCFPSITSQMNKELLSKLNYSGGDRDKGRRRGKSGKIIGKGRLKVRCDNYIAETMLGYDEISVRRLPHRTAMVSLSIPTFNEPVNYDIRDLRDWNSKLIMLDGNVSVLMFRESVTLISTTTGDILQHKQLPQQPPLDICQWTDDHFIVVFGKEMMVFNRDLRRLKTIKTEKYYNRIYKYNDNQLVCGGHYIRDSYYVDKVDVKDGVCKYEVCHVKMRTYERFEGEEVVVDVGVTSFGDVVVVKREWKKNKFGGLDNLSFVEWFREKTLVRRIKLEGINYLQEYDIQGPRLTKIGECVYITDKENNIYQIPGHIEQQTSEDIEILTLKDIQKYLLLRKDDNEVFQVLGFHISDDSFMVFGIIPGRQSFAFFYYDK
ncbi:uncharacterized protein LOC106873774 [Octopus bimaculoides]|uniref:Uncharacterized protein n=1 Tax=Octopus bimaculoides TaxID=37653 RepID=A0A0L8GZ58_OCTBM|nr:uncharacterized protein LOC106873774 [Octopus bimaculoides]|eukprot:XP_014776765.1 PREDICTED: uncharacterized protein LOC106873774 [Octopus bimaculoides]